MSRHSESELEKLFEEQRGIISVCQSETDTSRAQWVIEGCGGPLFTLNRWVPRGFDHYLRIFHSVWHREEDVTAERFVGDEQVLHQTRPSMVSSRERPVRWRDFARAHDRSLGPFDSFWDIHPQESELPVQPGDYAPPLDGTFEGPILDALGAILTQYSGTEQECLIAVWAGFCSDEIREALRTGCPTITGVGQQDHLILSAPLGVVLEKWRALLSDTPLPYSNSHNWPQAIWPTSREWFLAVPFDWQGSLFGGSRALVSKLLHTHAIECLPVPLEADFRGRSIAPVE